MHTQLSGGARSLKYAMIIFLFMCVSNEGSDKTTHDWLSLLCLHLWKVSKFNELDPISWVMVIDIYSFPPWNFFMLFDMCCLFSKSFFLEKLFQEYHLRVQQMGSESRPHIVGPDLVPSCSLNLSANDISRQWVDPFAPSVLFVGQRKIVQTLIRQRKMRRLILVSAVSKQNILLKFE